MIVPTDCAMIIQETKYETQQTAKLYRHTSKQRLIESKHLDKQDKTNINKS